METNVKQLKCGECGESRHKLFIRENGEIIAECIECGSTSEIKIVEKPKIKIQNLSGDGTLCVF